MFSIPIRNKQEDGQLVCQECGKLYKKYKPYHNHLQSKHGINLHAQSHRTDSTLQQRKKRSGRNSESKQTNSMVGYKLYTELYNSQI